MVAGDPKEQQTIISYKAVNMERKKRKRLRKEESLQIILKKR